MPGASGQVEDRWEDTPDGRWLTEAQVHRASGNAEKGAMMWRGFLRASPKFEKDENGKVVRVFLPKFSEHHLEMR